jgi:hypothetical protein
MTHVFIIYIIGMQAQVSWSYCRFPRKRFLLIYYHYSVFHKDPQVISVRPYGRGRGPPCGGEVPGGEKGRFSLFTP